MFKLSPNVLKGSARPVLDGAEFSIVTLSASGEDKVAFLAQIVGPAHADETPFVEIASLLWS
jgi:hypothetical protein